MNLLSRRDFKLLKSPRTLLAFFVAIFTISQTKAQVSGPANICLADPDTWSVPATAGASYSWNTFGAGIVGSPSNGPSANITWTLSGAQVLEVTETLPGGGTTTSTFSVTVSDYPNPVISGYGNAFCSDTTTLGDTCDAVCENSTLRYSTPEVSGNTYTWTAFGSSSIVPVPGSGNEVDITWGSPGTGSIVLVEETPGGMCSETVIKCIEIIDQPNADFNTVPSPTGGTIDVCLNQNVSFMNASLGASVFSWDFGDGSTGSSMNETHAWSSPGLYTVTLSVENDCGCEDVMSLNVQVNASEGPDIECISTLCADDTAYYWSASGCGPGASYNWTVNSEGNIFWSNAGGDSIGVVWDNTTDGCGAVTLEITGCGIACPIPTTEIVPIFVDNAPIIGPNTVCYGEDNVHYSIKKVPGTVYTWDLPDGGYFVSSEGNEVEISWEWLSPGFYTLDLAYENPILGCSGTTTLEVEIRPKLYISGSEMQCENEPSGTYSLYAVPGWTGVSANWEITQPDGVTIPAVGTGVSSISGYTWAGGPGGYLVTATAAPGLYCSVNANKLVQVLPPPPAPDPIVGEEEVCPGNPYHYSIVPNGPYTYRWSITGGTFSGGATTATGNSVNATWITAGVIEVVTIDATGSGCESAPTSLNVDLLTPLAPLTVFHDAASLCPDNQSTFSITSPVHPMAEITWEVSPSWLGSVLAPNTNNPTVSVQWGNLSGSGTVTVTYSLCSASITEVIPVTVTSAAPPTMTFPSPVCANSPVAFTTPAAGPWLWDFGDGRDTAIQNPTIQYTEPGTYVVSLTATNGAGCTIKNAQTITVNPTPFAYIPKPLPDECCDISVLGETVELSALMGPAGTSYSWSVTPVPTIPPTPGPAPGNSITHNETGVFGTYLYEVTLTNTFGCTDSYSRNVYERPTCSGGGGGGGSGGGCSPGPVTGSVTATISPASNCRSIDLSATFSAPGVPVGWTYGDGHTGGVGPTSSHIYDLPGFYEASVFVEYPNPTGGPPATCDAIFSTIVDVPALVDFDWQFQCAGGTMQTQLIDESLTHGGHVVTGVNWYLDGVLQPWSGSYPLVTVSPGTHIVRLEIATALGATCDFEQTIDFPAPPAADFLFPVQVCESANAIFTDLSTPASDITNWTWQFDVGAGNEGGTNIQSPIHSFVSTGPNTVRLEVSGAYGCVSQMDHVVDVLPNTLSGNITASPGLQICDGEVATLTAPNASIPGMFFGWSNGATGSVTAAALAGEYFVEMEDPDGCYYRTPIVTLEVNPAPFAMIFGEKDLCEWEPSTLRTTPGTAYTYNWSPGGPGSSARYISHPAGSYTYQVTITDISTPAGCSRVSPPFTVEVHDAPSPRPAIDFVPALSGPACAGSPMTLELTNPAEGLLYTWTTGDQTTWATGTPNPMVEVSEAGNYQVIATNEYGCSSISFTENIYPLPPVECVMAGCYTFCDTVMPKTWSGPGEAWRYTYYWYEVDATGSIISTPVFVGKDFVIDATMAGDYVLTMVDNWSGCEATSDLISISIEECSNCDLLNVSADSASSGPAGECCKYISIENNYDDNVFASLQFGTVGGSSLSLYDPSSDWSVSGTAVNHSSGFVPMGTSDDIIRVCVDDSLENVVISWMDDLGNVVCEDTIEFYCPAPPDPIDTTALCGTMSLQLDSLDGDECCKKLSLTNGYDPGFFSAVTFELPGIPTLSLSNAASGWTITGNSIAPTSGGIPLGISSDVVEICISDTLATVYAHWIGTTGDTICTDTLEIHCPAPPVDKCELLDLSYVPATVFNNGNCCQMVSLDNFNTPGCIGSVEFVAPTGMPINGFGLQAGWSLTGMGAHNLVLTGHGGTPVPTGSFDDLLELCIYNHQGASVDVTVNWYDTSGNILCTDIIHYDCTWNESSCLELSNVSVACEGDEVIYTFILENNSDIILNEIFINVNPLAGVELAGGPVVAIPDLLPGSTSNEITIVLDGHGDQVAHEIAFTVEPLDAGRGPVCGPTEGKIELTEDRCEPFVPNVFTPNGDGTNETFKPVFPCALSEYRLQIFDRWGKSVFLTEDMEQGWDGTTNGILISEGVYIWVLDYQSNKFADEGRKTVKGIVTLLR